MRVLLLPIMLLLCSCAQPARYVITSEDMKNISWENRHQRHICLTEEDARNNREILALYTKEDIEKYEQKRKDDRDPVEAVLYHLIRADYKKDQELLSQYGNSIPEYLRLMLKADLASEGIEENVRVSQLVKMYQEAFEVQPCAISRTMIQLRIRQLRYGR